MTGADAEPGFDVLSFCQTRVRILPADDARCGSVSKYRILRELRKIKMKADRAEPVHRAGSVFISCRGRWGRCYPMSG